MHAVCLTEPDADSEAWDEISAISFDATPSGALELRATRDIEAGVEVLGDYGPLSAAECLRVPLSASECLALPLMPSWRVLVGCRCFSTTVCARTLSS